MTHEAGAKLAVLIDADNVPAKFAKALFDEIAKFGDANIRRIYGDFTLPSVRSWNERLVEFALTPAQQFAYVKGKNASDITMVIDAMDLLHRGGVDGFCLISSDSDFTRLASRLRESGAAVYGFGERVKIEKELAFPKACSQFIYFENLIDAEDDAGAARSPGEKTPEKETPSKATPILRKAMIGLEDDDGWCHLGAVNQRIPSIAPDFDPRSYGCAKLIDLVKKSGGFDIDRPTGNQGAVRIRTKKQSARSRK